MNYLSTLCSQLWYHVNQISDYHILFPRGHFHGPILVGLCLIHYFKQIKKALKQEVQLLKFHFTSFKVYAKKCLNQLEVEQIDDLTLQHMQQKCDQYFAQDSCSLFLSTGNICHNQRAITNVFYLHTKAIFRSCSISKWEFISQQSTVSVKSRFSRQVWH